MAVVRMLCNRTFKKLYKSPISTVRSISVTPSVCVKEIKEIQDGKNIIISGVHVDSPRAPYLIEQSCDDSCVLCKLKLNVKHTDVLILSQFVRSDGCMLPRRITNLCKEQQKRMSTLVTMAQKAGLMSNLNPPGSKKDPKKRFGWKKHNKYFYDPR